MSNKYVIYKGSGGLIHMLNGISYCADWCIKNNYILLIDVINHKAFQRKFSDYFYLNNISYIEDYNILPTNLPCFKNLSIDTIKNSQPIFKIINRCRSYWIKDINVSQDLNNYTDILKVYCGSGGNMNNLTTKYIRVNKTIKLSKYIRYKEEYIGVHFRNTDRRNSIKLFIKEIQKYDIKKIYLATDDCHALKIFIKELPEYELSTYTTPIDANGKCIHFNHNDQDKLITNLLIDMYVLLKCNEFILSPNSLISKLLLYMRKTNESIFNI
jgi:hypothetical protein